MDDEGDEGEEDEEDEAGDATGSATGDGTVNSMILAAVKAIRHRAAVGQLIPRLVTAKEDLAGFLFQCPPPLKETQVSTGSSIRSTISVTLMIMKEV